MGFWDKALPIIGRGVSDVIGNITGATAARRQRRHEFKLAEYAYSKDLEMWNRQNAYNTPEAQMQRLQDAGLNPHLVYGTGTVAGNTSSQMPSYHAPRASYEYRPPVDPAAMLQMYQDVAQKSANIDHTKRQVDTEFARAWLTQTQAEYNISRRLYQDTENKFLNDTLADRTSREAASNVIQIAQSVIQRNYAKWAEMGLNPNDETWLRMTAQILSKLMDKETLSKLKAKFSQMPVISKFFN